MSRPSSSSTTPTAAPLSTSSSSSSASAPPLSRPAASASLVDRLHANAWKPPPPHQAGASPAQLDASTGYPFQVRCCEVIGSLTSPLLLHYRDTSTILYRVQQHQRKLVPQLIDLQTANLEGVRVASRAALDVTDSTEMIAAINGQVKASFDDIAARTTKSATMLTQMMKDRAQEGKEKEKEMTRRIIESTSNTVPSTPHAMASQSTDVLEGEMRIAPSAPASTASTPSSRALHLSTPASSTPSITPITSPQHHRPLHISSPSPTIRTTPVHTPTAGSSASASLRARVKSVFSPSAPTVVEVEEEDATHAYIP